MAKRAYRYRFYPDPEQSAQLAATFGCVRYVYNRALAERSRAWAEERRRVTPAETDRMLTGWKRDPETLWWAEPSKGPLQATLRHLQGALVNFWATRAGYPSFRKKGRTVDAAAYFRNCFTYWNGRITLARQGRPWDVVWSRPLPDGVVPSQVTVSRKQKGSKNRAKVRVRVARIHGRIADRCRDHLHQLSTRILRANQTVAIEDLPVRNHTLARAISDASWPQLRRMVAYKAGWYGRTVIAIDRFYPSSKTCSSCGTIVAQLPLNSREWECACGAAHDRDMNTAKNILTAGLSVTACGEGVRPPCS
ncbi:RNA-guided endonuclease TnpB family protein [Frankia sp. QA3]|uniref:RNA-guided endonuclease InsQ/TnpB family protein n=1 Tax=Frankia sp. QA3 TaxID=710111 RepID=UPI000269C621|nr:RNA-guided endonuclease TnpB family protein [Frankia sp. QA3]EIV94449.1 transposase, IS605 OrfB family, central region [Frankia sp. QA3]